MRCMPFDITPVNKGGGDGLALMDDAGTGLVPREGDGLIKKWLVFDNSVGFMPAGCADDHPRLAIINTLGKLGRSKPTKNNRMDSTKAGAAKHGDNRLGDHRHIDDHPVPRANAIAAEHAGKARRRTLQFGKGQVIGGSGDRRIIDDGILLTASSSHMPVHRIVAGVHLAIGKPAMKGSIPAVDCGCGRRHPVDCRRSVKPEGTAVRKRLCINRSIICHYHLPSIPSRIRSGRGPECPAV